MPEDDVTDYQCLVRAACSVATQSLSDDEDGDAGIDAATRTAARSFLRGEFERMQRDINAEPEGDDAGGE